MFVAATLSLLTTVLPQDPGTTGSQGGNGQDQGAEAPKPLLSEREQDGLRNRLREYITADDEYVRAVGIRDREKAGKARDKAKTRFEDEWDKLGKKGNLLGSMADLRAVFYNCFERKRPSHGTGQLYQRTIQDEQLDYSFFLPKTYKPEQPLTTLIVLPGTTAPDAFGKWEKTKEYFGQTWQDSPQLDTAIFHLPQIPEGLEMDPVPDYSREGGEIEEDRRNRVVLMTFRETMNGYNVDRGRVFLDCGRGTCGYGLRLATLFPDRFAGVILREPVPVDDIRIGNLLGIPMLMLQTDATKATVAALKTRIEEISPDAVTVIDAKGAYPHKESAPDIAQWLEGKQRDMSPKRIVLEPNHDRFNKAYWVDIETADSLLTTTGNERPRLEVEADRVNNRIVVKTVGIEQFELLLNDDLVDLDKEFTIVVNDKAIVEKRSRSFLEMYDRMIQRSDWDYLFPVRYPTTVPKE